MQTTGDGKMDSPDSSISDGKSPAENHQEETRGESGLKSSPQQQQEHLVQSTLLPSNPVHFDCCCLGLIFCFVERSRRTDGCCKG